MINRRYLLLIPLCCACSVAPKPFEQVLPAQVGEWSRGTVSNLSEIPPVVSQLGVRDAATAVYTGPASVTVRVFRMRADTSAFELIQKWRQGDGLAVYNGPYFVVAQPGDAPETAVRELLSRLRTALT